MMGIMTKNGQGKGKKRKNIDIRVFMMDYF